MHFFGAERGLLATPTQCGTYAVRVDLHALGRSPAEPDLDPVLHPRPRPGRRPLPGEAAALQPAGPGREPPTTPPAPTAPFGLEFARDDGDQNLDRARASGRRRASPRSSPGSPTARRRRSPQLAAPATPAAPSWPPPPARPSSRVGSARRRRRAPAADPLYTPGKRLSRRPLQGRAAQPRRRRARRSPAPTTSATSSSGPRSRSIPRPRRSRPSPTRCRRSSAGSRCASRSIRVNFDRPGFTLNPTNCDPFAVATTLFGDEGGTPAPSPPFQVANCASLPYGPKLKHAAHRRRQAARPPGDPHRLHGDPGRSEHDERLRHAAEGRAARQLPHRHGLHPGPVRRRRLPGRLA